MHTIPLYWATLGLLGVVWLYTFVRFRKLRGIIFVTSLVAAALAAFDYLLAHEQYWQPRPLRNLPASLEGEAFVILLTGFAVIAYEKVVRRVLLQRVPKLLWHKMLDFLPGIGIAFGLWFTLRLDEKSLLLIILISQLITVYLQRKDLLGVEIIAIASFGILFLLGFLIWQHVVPEFTYWWQIKDVSRIIAQYAGEYEAGYAFLFGAVIGPIYEFMTDDRNRDIA